MTDEALRKVTLGLTDDILSHLKQTHGEYWTDRKGKDAKRWLLLGFALRRMTAIPDEDMADLLLGVTALDEPRIQILKRLIAERVTELKRADSPAKRKVVARG